MQFDLAPTAQQWVNLFLLWIGFGILAGLLAKALIPGRDPAGAVGTLVIGVVGSVLGPLVLTLLEPRENFNPIGPLGFLTAVGGSMTLLVAYRIAARLMRARREAQEEEETVDSDNADLDDQYDEAA